ncbi:MAG: EAL domain-containing protein [Hyphomonadaceae bacterium]|nr:EAL domain-containing protein [Hyphomonadaceae bacterium]
MFRHLRVKLTVLYASLFCAALVMIGATAYAMIASNTNALAREQLVSAGTVFSRTWSLRLEHLQDNAFHAAASQSFVAAATARDEPAIRAQLESLRRSANVDLAFFVTREGLIVGEHGGASASVPPGLQMALGRDDTTRGVMRSGDALYQTAIAPTPLGNGWLVLGSRLDGQALAGLEELTALPLTASILVKSDRGWGEPSSADFPALTEFVDISLSSSTARARALELASGEFMALALPLTAIDGTRSVLLLRYSVSSALSPYSALFSSLFAIGLIGLLGLVIGTWFLARGITQPLSSLEEAAKHLREGVYDTVKVRTNDELSRLAESFNAMSEAIKERERRISQLAYYDAETRLPNRVAVERRLTATTQPERLYLAAIGVDRFAHVRGAIGYAMTGALMRALGARLAHLAPNAPVARLSSDVMCVAFLADNDADAKKRGEAWVANLEETMPIEGQNVDVSVSIGVAQPRPKTEPPARMIERASIALDQARATSQKVALFDQGAYGDPALNLSLMGDMRRALEAGHISLLHQPKYNFRTGRIDSAEVLVRWRHPTRGMIAPDLFVPMAEETGHIRALTEWVLRAAVADQKKLAAAGWPLTLAVNISARLLSDADFAESAVACVHAAPHSITFEITETAIMDNPKLALEHIEKFSAAGIKIAIDDYGSGVSSLAYLKQLPAHELKIDKVFIQNINTDQRDALLVRSTIDLAHGLGMAVVAEGVETPAVFAMLASMRCDMAQGYIVSRPATVEELVAILSDERRMRHYQQTAIATPGSTPTVVADATKRA